MNMDTNDYLSHIDRDAIKKLLADGRYGDALAGVAEPLHEALFRRQSFDLLDELPVTQRLVLVFDYILAQVGQGGFLQLIQNGYVSLLVTAIEAMQELKISPEMVQVFDNVLKVYVLNRDALDKETTVEEFSRMYDEFREFEALDAAFATHTGETIRGIIVNIF